MSLPAASPVAAHLADGALRILVVNAGSSSLKLSVHGEEGEDNGPVHLDAPDGRFGLAELQGAVDGFAPFDASVHRIVHGGPEFDGPSVVTDDVVERMEQLVSLAPLHMRPALDAVNAVRERFPESPSVVCFDTAFHAGLPDAAAQYALPAAWRAAGVRRYGFHGLSHAWVARRVPELTHRDGSPSRVVSCHLGAGASLAAVLDGRSVDTTMGFTPLEGLVMATRPGNVDAGVLLWLLREADIDLDDLERGLLEESGLRGLAGTADMRDVIGRAQARDPAACLALDVYVHRLRSQIASMTASLGGLDVLVFTGGVGEHAPLVRARVAAGLGFLDVTLDSDSNASASGDAVVSPAGAGVEVIVVASREDLQMVLEARALLAQSA